MKYAHPRKVTAFVSREYLATEIQIPMVGHYLVRITAKLSRNGLEA